MLFKRKEKPHILDRELLAEAITICSNKIDLKKMKYSKEKEYPKDTIELNEHLKVKIDSVWYEYDADWFMGLFVVLDYFILQISTYVDGIKMASYEFELNIEHNDELYRKWRCKEKKIIHYMPNQFIDLINDWSKEIVFKFDNERNKRKMLSELNEIEKYNIEETLLNKYI